MSQPHDSKEKTSLLQQGAEFAASRMSWNSMVDQLSNTSLPVDWRVGLLHYATQSIETHGIEQTLNDHEPNVTASKKLQKDGISPPDYEIAYKAALLDAVVGIATSENTAKHNALFTRTLKQLFTEEKSINPIHERGLENRFLLATRSFGWKNESKKQKPVDKQKKANSILPHMDGQASALFIRDLTELEALKQVSTLSVPEYQGKIAYPAGNSITEAVIWHDATISKKTTFTPIRLARLYGNVLYDEAESLLTSLAHTGNHGTEAIIAMNNILDEFVRWERSQSDKEGYTFEESELTLTESAMNVWGQILHKLGPLHTETVKGCAGLWWSAHSRFEGNVFARPATVFGLLSFTDDQQVPLLIERIRDDIDTKKTVVSYIKNAGWMEWWSDFFRTSREHPVSDAYQEALTALALHIVEDPNIEMSDVTPVLQNIFAISPQSVLDTLDQSKRIEAEGMTEKTELIMSLFPIADASWWDGSSMHKDAPNDALLGVYAAALRLRINPLTLWNQNADQIAYTAIGALSSFIQKTSA